MTLAVLLHAVGEVAQTPILALLDLAALFRDQLSKAVGQGINLCARDVLARNEHILVKRHRFYPLWLIVPVLPASFLRAVGPSRSGQGRAGKGAAHYSQRPLEHKRAARRIGRRRAAEAPRQCGPKVLDRRKPFGEFGRLVGGLSGMADVVPLVSARRLDANAHLQDAPSRVRGRLRDAERAGDQRSGGWPDAGVA